MNKIFQVKYTLHPLFIIIILISIITGFFIELMLLFVFVLVHEWGHLLMAQHLGWHVKEIKLLPFGGVLIVDDAQASSAKEELLVTVAGPLQNIWIILLTMICGHFDFLSYEWTNYIIIANVWLFVFNMLPILPLDGGKLMQCLLSYVLPYFQTMKLSAWLSIIFSFLMVLFGLTFTFWFIESGPQLNLMLVGCFLFADNAMKLKHLPYVLYRFILHREKAISAMSIDSKSKLPITILVAETDTLISLYKRVKREASHIFFYKPLVQREMKMTTELELLKLINEGSYLNRALIDILD